MTTRLKGDNRITLKDHTVSFKRKLFEDKWTQEWVNKWRLAKPICSRGKRFTQYPVNKPMKVTKPMIDLLNRNMDIKNSFSFVYSNIQDFYCSIKEEILDKTIVRAKSFTFISNEQINIKQRKKVLVSCLMAYQSSWVIWCKSQTCRSTVVVI